MEVAVPPGWALMPACLLWMDLSYGLDLSWTWAAITKCHRLGGLNNRGLFFTVLEARMSKIKVLVDLVLGEGSLPDLTDGRLLSVSSWRERRRSLVIKPLMPL